LVSGIWTPAQGSDPQQKGGITPVPRSLGEVEFCKGVKRSETIPSRLSHIIKKSKKSGKIYKFFQIFYTTDTQMFTQIKYTGII